MSAGLDLELKRRLASSWERGSVEEFYDLVEGRVSPWLVDRLRFEFRLPEDECELCVREALQSLEGQREKLARGVRGPITNPVGYLRRAARNKAVEVCRRRKKEAETLRTLREAIARGEGAALQGRPYYANGISARVACTVVEASLGEAIELSESVAVPALKQAIGTLPRRLAEATLVVLRLGPGIPDEVGGEELGVGADTFRSYWSQARAALRKAVPQAMRALGLPVELIDPPSIFPERPVLGSTEDE